MKKSILVTGGAGYIGSHIVRQLTLAEENIVVLDNLVTGFAKAVVAGKFIQGDVGDIELVKKIIHDYHIDTVIHLAAYTNVAESMTYPEKYYDNNAKKIEKLLQACLESHIQYFILSSTAAVYGSPDSEIVDETHPTVPINPYGISKLMSESAVKIAAEKNKNLHTVILRYFNVAGADASGQIGQATTNATTLIKVVVEALTDKREFIEIFGSDYPTLDGTCQRDYIHVTDVANAHCQALNYLREKNKSLILNCGYGHGYSVKEVIAAAEQLANRKLKIHYAPRRVSDPVSVIANNRKIKEILNWIPQFDDINIIIKTALAWEKNPKF